MNRTRHLTVTGIFSGLGFVLMFLEFPIFPQAGFLKYDPSDVVAMIVALGMGYYAGITVVLVKDVLFYLAKSGDPVGIAMNALAGVIFVIVSKIAWKKFPRLISTIIVAVVVTAVMVAANALVVPLYFKAPFEMFLKFLPFIVAFNLIKFVISHILGCMIFDRIEGVFRLD